MAEQQLKQFCDLGNRLLNGQINTIVEIGARDCVETLFLANYFPQATVYAFECNPETLPLCQDKVRNQTHVHLIEAAVTNKSGLINFYQIDTQETRTNYPGGNPGASSLFQSSGTYPLEDYVQKQIMVRAITLQDFFKENRIKAVDLLWMDIQGAELLALKGAGTELSKIKMIHLEVGFFEIYKHQPLFGEVRSFLQCNGFAFLYFTHLGRYSGDAIFVRQDLSPRPRWMENMALWTQLIPRKIKNLLS